MRTGWLEGGSTARSLHVRQCGFDAARYDRMRVLSTELRRIVLSSGEVDIVVRGHRVDTARVYASM